jgi:hypothetical protein
MSCIGSIKKEKYVYILLDPRKPGFYDYSLGISFLYEPFYVGMGNYNRWEEHISESLNQKHLNEGNCLKKNKIRKILKSEKTPLNVVLPKMSKKLAKIQECVFIDLIGRLDLNKGPLTNMTDGGDCCSILGRKGSGMSGKKHSNNTKEKLSEKSKNAWKNENYRKICGSTFLGKKHTSEYKEKMKKLMNKHYKCISPEGISYYVDDLREFCNKNNLSHWSMCNTAREQQKQHKGWICIKEEIKI